MHQVELLNKSKNDVSNELNRSKEDNEELKFQVSSSHQIYSENDVFVCKRAVLVFALVGGKYYLVVYILINTHAHKIYMYLS